MISIIIIGILTFMFVISTRCLDETSFENLRLEQENAKLAEYVLGAQKENLLLPEHTEEAMMLLSSKCKKDVTSTDVGVSKLLDLIEKREITHIIKEPDSKYKFTAGPEQNLLPLITLEFGDLAIRYLRFERKEDPVLIYKGALICILTKDFAVRAHKIFLHKITEAATKELNVNIEFGIKIT